MHYAANPPADPRTKPDVFGAAVIAVVLMIFGVLVVYRSAYMVHRHTDAGVYFRAGWAVRTGTDPYRVVDDNENVYLYAPGVAIPFALLADPPRGEARAWCLPFSVEVTIWYVLSAMALVLAAHWMASALEAVSPWERGRRVGPGDQAWWMLRVWPLLLILPDAGGSLAKGQIDAVVLAFMSAGMLLCVRRVPLWGGFGLAMAGCIKPFTGLIAIEPRLRARPRFVLGMALGVGVLLFGLPAAVYGPARAAEFAGSFLVETILPSIGLSEHKIRQAGTSPADFDNLSIAGTLHNLTNLSMPRGQRPDEYAPWILAVHLGVSAALVAATLGIGRRESERPRVILLRMAMLGGVMLLASPMCHRFYYIYLLPLIAAAVYEIYLSSGYRFPRGAAWLMVLGYPVVMSIPRLEQQGLLRDLPLPQIANLGLWSVCALAIRNLARRPGSPSEVGAVSEPVAA
jgi:hypothetical protein